MSVAATGAIAAVAVFILFVILVIVAAWGRAAVGVVGGGGAARVTRDAARAPPQWDGPAPCLSQELALDCARLVRARVRDSGRFGPATAGDMAALASAAAAAARTHKAPPLRPDQLAAMWNMEVAVEARAGGARAARLGPKILAACRAGEKVVDVAARLRVPPTAALRAAAGAASAAGAATRLPLFLERDAAAAAEADLGSRVNADRIRARAQDFEDALGAHLRTLGVGFHTEEDLRRRGGEGPLLTPDFLLTGGGIRVGDHTVHWIDAKNYLMYGSRLVAASLVAQAEKYTRAFGPGAMVFSGGVMCGAVVECATGPSPLLLDGSHVRKK